jgi:hypothetical protein
VQSLLAYAALVLQELTLATRVNDYRAVYADLLEQKCSNIFDLTDLNCTIEP